MKVLRCIESLIKVVSYAVVFILRCKIYYQKYEIIFKHINFNEIYRISIKRMDSLKLFYGFAIIHGLHWETVETEWDRNNWTNIYVGYFVEVEKLLKNY